MLEEPKEPPLLGRDAELQVLRARFDAARQGRGGVLLVSGEAGVGKTSLVKALAASANTDGAAVLTGRCVSDSMAPFLPVMEAFGQANLGHVFAEEAPPKVEGVYCASSTGLLVSHVERKGSELDPSIFTSMLGVVGDFVEDSVRMFTEDRAERRFLSMQYGEYRVVLEHGRVVYIAAILKGKESEFLIEDLRSAVLAVERDFGGVLVGWDGNMDRVQGLERILVSHFFGGQYDGVDLVTGHPSLWRNRLFEASTLALARLAAAKPVLLWIEDLHVADPSTLALLCHLARNCTKAPALIVGTYRPEELPTDRPHPLLDTVKCLGDEGLLDALELRPLDQAGTGAVASSMLGPSLPGGFLDTVYRETEGNPLFIKETVRVLVLEGALRKSDGGWSFDARAGHRIPSRVFDAVMRRVNRLEPNERRVLDYGAVVGEVLDPDLLAMALGLDRARTLEILQRLETTRRLVHAVDSRFRFDHARIREVVYDALPVDLRRAYHSIVARCLEERYAEDATPVLDALALHYARAGNVTKGVAYLVMAAEGAAAKYANAEALRYADEALALMDDQAPDPTRLKALRMKAELLRTIGDYDGCTATLGQLLAVAETLQSFEFVSFARHNLGIVAHRRGKPDAALVEMRAAVEAARRAGSAKLEAEALAGLGYIFQELGQYKDAEECLSTGLARGLKLGDPAVIARTERAMGILLEMQGRLQEAKACYEKSLALLENTGDVLEVAKLCNDMATFFHRTDDYASAVKMNTKCLELSRKVGDARACGYASEGLGSSLAQLGDFEGAQERLGEALAIFQRLGMPTMIAATHRELGTLRSLQGEFEAAMREFDEALAIYRRDGKWPYFEAYTLRKLGEMQVRKGDRQAARDALTKSLEIYARLKSQTEIVELQKELATLDHAPSSANPPPS